MTALVYFVMGLLIGGVLMGIVANPWYGVAVEDEDTECHTFYVGTEDEFGMVLVGEVELCGKEMEWGNVHGPMGGGDRGQGM